MKSDSNQKTTIVSIKDIKGLEYGTIKVPYELFNKKYRSTQRIIEKEVSQVSSQVKELENVVTQASRPRINGEVRANVGQIKNLLTGVVEKLNQLKRKSIESIADEKESVYCCKRRLEHLKEDHVDEEQSFSNGIDNVLLNGCTSRPRNTEFGRKHLDRMLVEHFLRCGYYDTAIKLARESQVEDLTNIDLFLVSRKVEESLVRRETMACLNWCQDNKSKLRKIKSTLEFNVRVQEFVELIRVEKHLDAIKYARQHFSPLAQDEQLKIELPKVLGLLAFKQDTKMEPYKSYFNEDRWYTLVKQFRKDNFELYGLSSTSVFALTLQCGLSVLKTPHCYKKRREDRNPDCPVCNDLLNQLAKPLPVAHCSHSKLVCYITGKPLNENNPPLALPNGNVYGELALRQMATENDGKVVCARTNETFNFSDLSKVFVM